MSQMKLLHYVRAAVAISVVAGLDGAAATDWKPADGPLLTRWAKDVKPDKAWPEYPRPQMRRDAWLNLNGVWQFAFAKEDEEPPDRQGPGRPHPRPLPRRVRPVRRHEARPTASGIAAPSPSRKSGPASACCSISAPSIGKRPSASTASSSASTTAATTPSPSTSPTPSIREGGTGTDRRRLGLRPTAARSRAASRSTSPAASSTRLRPASGRRSGWSRCRRPASTA